IYQWNFSIEQNVAGSMVLRVSYQGSKGRDLFHAAELNPAIYGPGATRTNTDRRRPRPEFTQLTFAGTYGRSNYDALVLSLERRAVERNAGVPVGRAADRRHGRGQLFQWNRAGSGGYRGRSASRSAPGDGRPHHSLVQHGCVSGQCARDVRNHRAKYVAQSRP